LSTVCSGSIKPIDWFFVMPAVASGLTISDRYADFRADDIQHFIQAMIERRAIFGAHHVEYALLRSAAARPVRPR
jgi:hypothetical protein